MNKVVYTTVTSMNSYFEQGGFYGGGSGGEQAYRFPPLGLSVGHYGQPAPRQDAYDPSASCKLYPSHQDHMTPNPFKVDCSATKDQNGYGAKDMSVGWGQSARPVCTPDPISGRGYPPDPSTSPRDRAHVGTGWNTCGMTAAHQQPHHQQQPQQTPGQMGGGQSATTFYPWMALAGKISLSIVIECFIFVLCIGLYSMSNFQPSYIILVA